MGGFLEEGVDEVDEVVDMEGATIGGAPVDMEEDLRIEVVVVGMMMIGVVVVLHSVTAEAVTEVAGEVLSLARAISAVNQGTGHPTVPKDGDEEKDLSKVFKKKILLSIGYSTPTS